MVTEKCKETEKNILNNEVMKRIKLLISYFALIFMVVYISSNIILAQPNSGPKFEYLAEDNRIEMDTLFLDWAEDVQLDVEFINKGEKPLIVKNVSACCGTQIKEWTQKPLLPGEKGTITVEFRVPPRPHRISRTVKAITNDPDGTKTLHIVGVVIEPKEEGVIDLQKREY